MPKHPNYELFEELGRGENSIVYRAWDLALSRDVAIKELKSEPRSEGVPSDPKRVEQFLQEASFLAQFQHENVLRIHTVDQERGWIVMELMKASLTNQIASQPMSPEMVRSVIRQILNALDFLHKKNKVHGSVRPSNILINEEGIVKLSDFEASSYDSELRVPQGSKKYLAPELIRSEFGKFGPTVDLYCLGFTALELLTGKKFDSLFPGTGEGAIDADVAWLRWHSSDEAMQPVKKIAPKVPNDLALVIDKLLTKPVDDRPATAAAVLKLLDDIPLVPVEVSAPIAGASTKPGKTKASSTQSAKRSPAAPKKKTTPDKKKAQPSSSKDRLNETFSKPYILWPICVGMLVAALFLGLYLRDKPTEVAGGGTPEPPITSPQQIPVELNVLPDASGATLSIGGKDYPFEDLILPPGNHLIVVNKEGFEPYARSIDVDSENTNFNILLRELAGTPDPIPSKPKFVDVRISVSPPEAALTNNGEPVQLNDGILRINPEEVSQLNLIASADGYQTKDASWSLDELANLNYELQLALEMTPEPKAKTGMTLPFSLVAKTGAALDAQTGLPLRAYVRTLQESAPLEMALVVPSEYQFGVVDGNLRTWELDLENVTVEQPYYIGITEVSNAQFRVFAENASENDATNQSPPELPVTNVSARKAAQFCDWAGGRLPTEQEWEVAVRGPDDSGYPLPWSNGNAGSDLDPEKCKLFRGETEKNNGPVQIKALAKGANQLGLLNTIGNVAEWCDNRHKSDQFIIKGCSFRIPPGDHVRVTWRYGTQWKGANDVGLRLLVPVVPETTLSSALTFVEPSNLDSLVVSLNQNDPNESDEDQTQIYTKTVQEIAAEFAGQAELVIDSGGFMSEITDVRFSPDGQRVAVGGSKIVRIWDVNSGQLLKTVRGDMSRTSYGNVNTIAWSPDGKYLLVGVSDYREHGNIRVHTVDDLDEIVEVLGGHTAPCRKLVFSRDGSQLVSVDADGLILVRDWASKQIQHRIPAENREKPIFDIMKFPTDGPFMLGVDFEGPKLFSAKTGQRVKGSGEMPVQIRGWFVDIFNKLIKLPHNAKSQPRVMDFRMEDGRWVGAGSAVVKGRSRFWARVWESRAPVSAATPAKELGAYDQHRWNITAIALQPKGTLVASGDKFGEVHIWDSKTGKRKFKFAGQGKPIYEVAFDTETTRLAFGMKPYSPKEWNRNNHGDANRVLDLRQRTIADVASQKGLSLRDEQPTVGNSSLTVKKRDAYYVVERLVNGNPLSEYRISSGRNPTVFTLLDEPKLGVEHPVVFGDNEGLLALWDSAGDELKRAFIGHGGLVSAISAASNGKLIATASTDRTIRLWSLEDYIPTGIFDFKFENSAVRKITPGSSSEKAGVKIGDRIVSIDGNSLTEMFELMLLGKFNYKPDQIVPVKMKRGDEFYEYEMQMAQGYDFAEPILNFYMGDDGQWIIWHPHGYYDASPGADRLIGWHINRGFDKTAKFFEVQQFSKELYRPDIIDGILEKGSLEQALAGLEKNATDDSIEDFRKPEVIAKHLPPSVKITWPTDSWRTEAETVTVKGEATSVNGLPITALTLLHNGYVAKVFRPTKVNQLSMKIEHEMKLTPGANDLVLIAANSKSSSQGKHIVVNLDRPKIKQRPSAWVLAIGVSEFDDIPGGLPHAASDAQGFAEAMMRHDDGRLYGSVKTKLLSNRVTNDEILDGFQWLTDNTKAGDVAMVYVASHGVLDRRDNFYIGSSNTSEAKARSTAVSWRDLMNTLQLDLPDCKRMVFLDLKPTTNAIRPGLRNPLLDLAAPEMGTIFLSSNTLQQNPVSSNNMARGVFLQAVLDTVGDRKFDTTPSAGDSLINPTELAFGVKSRLKDLTQDQQQLVFFTPEFARLANVLELSN